MARKSVVKDIHLIGRINIETSKDLLSEIKECNGLCDLYINSTGGCVTSARSILGYLKITKKLNRLIVLDEAFSSAALIFVSVPIKQRYAVKNSTFIFHYPSFETYSTLGKNDIGDMNKDMTKECKVLEEILIKESDLKIREIKTILATDRKLHTNYMVEHKMLLKKNLL